jgi:hypothetical protein
MMKELKENREWSGTFDIFSSNNGKALKNICTDFEKIKLILTEERNLAL